MKKFVWQPGEGIDPAALARLRAHFRKPSEPMGEGWFMGKQRHMFTELLRDADTLTVAELERPLFEIASGTSSFGPFDEWKDWYHHLLAQLLPRSHESYLCPLLEPLVSCFCALYPSGIGTQPYHGFQDDILNTLGRCMMDPDRWFEGDVVFGDMLQGWDGEKVSAWVWLNASGDLSASMFLCLKYLPPSLVPGWLESVFAICSPIWRAQVLAWLVGAERVLRGELTWPSQFERDALPSIDWEHSHCLRAKLTTNDRVGPGAIASFIPTAARTSATKAIRTHFTREGYASWMETISRMPGLESSLVDIPSKFERLYLNPD